MSPVRWAFEPWFLVSDASPEWEVMWNALREQTHTLQGAEDVYNYLGTWYKNGMWLHHFRARHQDPRIPRLVRIPASGDYGPEDPDKAFRIGGID